MKNLFLFSLFLLVVFSGCITDSVLTGEGLAPTRNLTPSATPDSTLENYLVPASASEENQAEPEAEQAVAEDESVLPGDFEEPLRVTAEGVEPTPDYLPIIPDRNNPNEGSVHLWNTYALEGISSSTFTQPKVADLDGDGDKEIISALMSASVGGDCEFEINQGIYAWDSSGNLKSGFPVYINELDSPFLCGYLSIVGVGDVVGDSKLEIVAAVGRTIYAGGVYIISSRGRVLTQLDGTPRDTGFSNIDILHAVLYDLDGDDKLEIIASAMDSTIPDRLEKLYVWKGDGSLLPGWPKTSNNGIFGEPVVFGSGSNKRIVVYNGNINGWPHSIDSYSIDGTLLWRVDLDLGYQPSLIAADVDADGDVELVVKQKQINQPPPYIYNILIINSDDGSLENQWSVETGYTYDFGISLGDLNEDGRLEIIAHDSTHFYVFNLDGSPWPNFPVSINDIDPNYPHSYLTSIGVADLDGDTFPDLYGEALYNNGTVNEGDFMYSIYAINRLGQSLQGFPFRLINYEGFPPGLYYSFQELYLPTFADINKDRIADIVASKGWGRIEAFTLNHPYNKSSAIFPQYGVDEQNTKFVKLPS